MNVLLNKQPEESEEQYIWRIGRAKDDGVIDLNWNDLGQVINQNCRQDESEYYQSCAYRKQYQNAKRFYDAGVFDDEDHQERLKEISAAKIELEKERKKVQTEKLEYNKWLREKARDEMISDSIFRGLLQLKPLKTPKFEGDYSDNTGKEYLLCFGDCHYGIEFELKGLNGETINEYSPEIFENRMWNMLEKLKETIKQHDIKRLVIFEMGDGIQGIIRLNSQLLKLRFGIIESTLNYAEFLAHWLNELSKYVTIEFQMVEDSNHNQLRICGAPKNAFSDENMSKIIIEFLRQRLAGNAKVFITDNATGFNLLATRNYNIVGIHGEVNNFEKAISDISRAYQFKIDYLIGGHRHHRQMVEVGRNQESLTVGSIIGVDPYGLSLSKTSSPSASLFVFDDTDGKVEEIIYKLG